MASVKDTRIYDAARRAKARLSYLLHERGLHDTGVDVDREDLGVFDPHYTRYEASSWRWVPRALRGRKIGSDDVFVDLGSGKGRVLLAAARYPFGRVIGVEIAEALNEIARENVAAARNRLRCKDVELVTADVTQWTFPPDVNYVYMFNPVGGDHFRRVFANLVESMREHPRPVTVIYANPTLAEIFDESRLFRRAEVIKNPWRPDIGPSGWVNIYESVNGA